VLLSADDIEGADAERLGYVTRALPDADLDDFVDTLAARIASFDKWAIANTKRLVNALPAPRRRNQSRLGHVPGLNQPTSGAGKNQRPPRAMLPGTRGFGKSTRVPSRTAGPNRRG
jgi:hypothetical protein